MEVSMKMIADQVVSRVSTLAAARGPKAVCEPWPPKAPARSAERPCCKRTTKIKTTHTAICTPTTKTRRKFILIAAFQVSPADPDARDLVRKRGLEPLCLVGASTSSWCVCQFRHLRTQVNSTSIAKVGDGRNNFPYSNIGTLRQFLPGCFIRGNMEPQGAGCPLTPPPDPSRSTSIS